MQRYFHILLVSLTSISFFSCAHDSNKKGILEDRAGYKLETKNSHAPKHVTRTMGKIKKAWLHAHEMPSGDYFGGAWVFLLIEQTKWNFPDRN